MLLVLLGLMASAGVASVVIDHYDDDEANSAETETDGEDAAARAGTSGVDMASGGGVESAGGTKGASGTAQPAEEEVTAPEDEEDAAEEGAGVVAGAEDEGTETAADDDPVAEESPAPEAVCGETVSYEQLVAAEIAGEGLTLGDGDDFVDAMPPGGLYSDLHVELDIDLGGGDDTIVGPFIGSHLSGGAGDDLFEVEETYGEVLTIDGGEGNDTIDARTSDNATLIGGAGDDVIHSMGRSWDGTGYVINVDGGEGDDTLHVHAESDFAEFPRNQMGAINGGEGIDHFVVSVNDEVHESYDLNNFLEHWGNEAGTGVRSNVVELGDFDPSTETLELHISSPNEDFEPASVHIEEEGVVVTYQSDIYPDLEMLISCDTEGLTADQVTLVGADPAILVGSDPAPVVCA